jgi:hypothetical protein
LIAAALQIIGNDLQPVFNKYQKTQAPPVQAPDGPVTPSVTPLVTPRCDAVSRGEDHICHTVTPISEGTPIIAPFYVYITDEDQLSGVIQDLREPGDVALDIETYYPDAKVTKAGKRMKVAATTVCDRYRSKIRLLQCIVTAQKPSGCWTR